MIGATCCQLILVVYPGQGRGGRTAAMDPRLDPSIDPKRAKRILANRQSAARSKNKQRGHLDSLEAAQNVLVRQKSILLKEVAWLRVRFFCCHFVFYL